MTRPVSRDGKISVKDISGKEGFQNRPKILNSTVRKETTW